MKHILGMAKSFLDLKGAKSPKLELDYLRLVFAVDDLRRRGDRAQGYLIVLTPQILDCVKKWENKYRVKDSVKIIEVSLSNLAKNRLLLEKKSNIDGMVVGTTGGKVGDRSNANFSRQIGERALKDKILELELGVKQIIDESKYPYYIRWDFYGILD